MARPSAAPPATVPPAREVARDRAWLIGFAGLLGAAVTVGLWLRHNDFHLATGAGGSRHVGGSARRAPRDLRDPRTAAADVARRGLERAIGLDRLAVWHRWTGFAALWLLVAHVAFTTLGWARASIPSVGVLHETGWMITHEPDILMAWVGFGLLVAVAVTSVRIACRKLRRETWYFVHLYAYLAIVLSFAHQLAVGSDFEGDRAARIWWVMLYVIVGVAIVRWRVIEPIRFNRRHALRVAAVRPEAPGVVSIIVTGRELDRVEALPGQFFMWRFVTRRDWWKPHPVSRSRPRRTSRACASPSRTWATTAGACNISRPGHASSPRVPTAHSPRNGRPSGARC